MIDFVYKGKCVCTCFPRDMYHMNTDPHRLPQYLKFDNARMSGCYGHIVMGRVAAASRCGVWGSRLNQPIAGTVAQKLADHISGSPVGRRCLSRLEDHLRQINFHIGASLHAGSSVVCACPRMWTARAPHRRQVSVDGCQVVLYVVGEFRPTCAQLAAFRQLDQPTAHRRVGDLGHTGEFLRHWVQKFRREFRWIRAPVQLGLSRESRKAGSYGPWHISPARAS